jgi:uncharacterized protein YjbI with pentapeptide repeats
MATRESQGMSAGAVAAQRSLPEWSEADRSAALDAALRGAAIEAKGVIIDGESLSQLAALLPRDEDGRSPFGDVDFSGSVIRGPLDLSEVRFGDANFQRVSFEGAVNGYSVRFDGRADFDHATFASKVDFSSSHFCLDAFFQYGQFDGPAYFDRTTFDLGVSFGASRFHRPAYFQAVQFAGTKGPAKDADTSFQAAVFEEDANFFGSTIRGGEVTFKDALFAGNAGFADAFLRARDVIFDGVRFASDIEMFVKTERLSCIGTRFGGGATLHVITGLVALDQTEFGGPSRMEGLGEGRPQLFSLRRTDVEQLTLADIDLSACRFMGAHNLEAVRIEGDRPFAEVPAGWRRTRRQVIAEEWDLRIRAGDWPGGTPYRWPDEYWPGGSLAPPIAPRPRQVAAIYRTLRKAQEDRSDAPGAADLYYGEMEMRRKVPPEGRGIGARLTWFGERAVLTLYWLTCGYGLRASRAFAAAALAVVLFAALFYLFGQRDPDVSLAFLHSAEGLALRGPEAGDLTEGGRALQLALRLIGPALLGLAILSLRGRVKR